MSLSKQSLGQRIRSLLFLLVLIGGVSLAQGCSGLNPVSLLTGGGPNIAANTQLGQENNQTVGLTQETETTLSVAGDNTGTVRQDTSETKVENKDSGTVNINEVSPLLFGTLILCFVFWSYFLYKLPSPDQIWKKKKNI
jgi:hypothetical protein